MIHSSKNILNHIKELPPVVELRKKKYEKKFATNQYLNLFKGIYPNFEMASAAAKNYQTKGYNNKKSAQMYQDMCHKIFPEDYPTLYWINRLIPHISSLIDFGGHVGIKRYAFDSYLEKINQVKWSVYDLPKVIDEAKNLKTQLDPQNEINLNFLNDLENQNTDLFMALGSFQYIPKEVPEVLEKLSSLPQYLLISIPVTKKNTFLTLNHIGTTVCPYIIRNEDEFLKGIKEKGYSLKDSWSAPNKICEIPFHEEYSVYGYSGFVFEKS
ncbi:MAG: hypothetical protein CME60_05225 [Halobacteriovoraceae bacterium]|nr:hypothetical protein [Halobacteriovoraceae bacterium]|tara:strand:+ start:295 stop:1101 length:807 start_codon:yes stop_codon:yes gene_type:complete